MNEESFKIRSSIANGLVVIGTLALFLTLIILASMGYFTEPFTNNNANNMTVFPQLGDAFKTGIYRTFGQECKPGMHKCKAKDQYWCSSNKNCTVGEHHLQGTLFEPEIWFDRYV